VLPDLLLLLLGRPLLTLERVQILKRDGVLLAEPAEPPAVELHGGPACRS